VTRSFEAKPSRRERTPIAVGIVSPSGAGKTKSALRLADGFARVTPGPIVVIDTEAKRALHHSDAHKFLHIDMEPPFGPSDHIAAWTEALRHKPSTIIQDSMSHEWIGSGGVLELHDVELDRMAGNDYKKRERCTMAAWIKPKAEHNRMKQFMLQQRVNWILCFRAGPKIKPQKGGEPIDLGWQALGAADLIYEMLVKCVLFPGADGKPTWKSEKMGEQELMKLPGWFRDLFGSSRQLDEDIGEQLARWAVGGDVGAPSATATSSRPTSPTSSHPLLARYAACQDRATWDAIESDRGKVWKAASGPDKLALKSASDLAMSRIGAATADISAEEAAEIARNEAREA
jgi:hypothetical protein